MTIYNPPYSVVIDDEDVKKTIEAVSDRAKDHSNLGLVLGTTVIPTISLNNVFKHYTDAVSIAGPVQNDWNNILTEKRNCRVYSVSVAVAADNETLELRAYVDGEWVPAVAEACTAGTVYHGRWYNSSTTASLDLNSAASYQTFSYLLEGAVVRLQVRKTTALGVGAITTVTRYGLK